MRGSRLKRDGEADPESGILLRMPLVSTPAFPSPRRLLVSGSTGLIGRRLVAVRRAGGDTVLRLVRDAAGEGDVLWDAGQTALDPGAVSGFDAVIHLAGEPVAGRWNADKKRRILESRVRSTEALAEAIARAEQPPAVFVCASGINYYGDRGSAVVDESAPSGSGFLAEVCEAWEAASLAAAGVARVVNLRIGMVLAAEGGALATMLPVFRLGLGGPIGGGAAYVSWVTLEDLVRAIGFALDAEALGGAVDVVTPHPVTNREFTADLGAALGRPAVIPVPGWVTRVMFGEMADETVLASVRAVPRRLLDAGFVFREPQLVGALASLRLRAR